MKHLLEYEDLEIESLLRNLDSIGQMKVYRGTLCVFYNIYRMTDKIWSGTNSMRVLETGPIYGTGDEHRDVPMMLKSIQRGEFRRPPKPRIQVSVWKTDISWKSYEEGNPKFMDELSKENLVSLAKKHSKMDEFLGELKERLEKAQLSSITPQNYIYTGYTLPGQAINTLVYGFLGPEGSPELERSDLKLGEDGNGINYIDQRG